MTATTRWLLSCGMVGALGTVSYGVEFSLKPVGASGVHVINGNQIVLQGADQIVKLELRVDNWAAVPDVGTCIDSSECSISQQDCPSGPCEGSNGIAQIYQVRIDPSGYGGVLTTDLPCTDSAECTAFGNPLTWCDTGAGLCNQNAAGFIDEFHPDYLFVDHIATMLFGVVQTTPDWSYGAIVVEQFDAQPWAPGDPDRYLGTLVLHVPPGTTGSFTVGYNADPAETILADTASVVIQPITTIPVVISIACTSSLECDDNNLCTTDTCLPNQTCSNVNNFDDAVSCCDPLVGPPVGLTPLDDGNECTVGICNADGTVTQNPLAFGTACGNPAGAECDAQDTCDGAGTCIDRVESAGTSCGDGSDTECDNPDACDGAGICLENREPAGFSCGDPTSTDCNLADTCDGSGTCLDNILPDGAACGSPTDTECNAADTCDGAGSCSTNLAPSGLPCGNPLGDACDNPDSCDGAGACNTNPVPAGTLCGNPGSSACDNPDSCNGAGVCAANNVADGTTCPDDGNECRDDVCQGGSCAHPLKPEGSVCGDPSDTGCDNPDACDASGVCQPNLEPPGAACGDPANTDCNRADSCDGGGNCLANIEPGGTACGNPVDTDCDDPDTCDGAGACQSNVALSGLPCGNAVGNQCDNPDTCDGVGACSTNFVAAATPCGNPGSSECDNADSCDGAGSCDPNHLPDSTACTDDGNECRADVCLTGVCSHPLETAGTACGDPTDDDCNGADACDGTGTCLPNLVSVGTPCGDTGDTVCTNPDTCNGFGTCLPNHASDGTDCDDGSFCNAGATCLGGGCGGGSAIDCSDGLPCTLDTCNEPLQQCDNDLIAENCLIADACYADAGLNPANDCETCDTGVSTSAWTLLAAGTLCDDGDACTGTGPGGTGDDTCDALGVCSGVVDPDCNDDCVNAVEVFDGTNLGNNAGRGPDLIEASCRADSNNDIWFFYVSPCTAEIAVDTEGSAFAPANDTVLSVYTGCTAQDEIACDDDGGFENLAALSFSATAGSTYWIRVAGFQQNVGNLQLNIATLNNCVIDGTCYAPGTVNPTNECEACILNFATDAWSARPGGTACNAARDADCNNPSSCNGFGVCETNQKPDGTVCTDDGNDCTDDVCSVGNCSHPPKALGTACGDGTVTECDNANTCDGASACLDNFAPAGVACGDPSTSDCDNADVCDGAGACDPNPQADGTTCTDDGTECTADVCAGGNCTHPAELDGTPCGDGSNTQCDSPDTCDGAGGCRSNFQPSGVTCGDPADLECDNPDTCNGSGACVNNFEPVGFTCGDPADTGCDNPDTCNGGGACQDNLELTGFPCGDPGSTQCDLADTCDGTGICLDNFVLADTACGNPGSSECDNADICDGVGACNPNHQPDGLICTDDGEECTFDECGGGDCIHPSKLAGTPCSDPSNTQCDDPDTCDGAGSCLDNFEASGVTCGDPTGAECDDPDTCNGAGSCADNFQASGVACGDPLDNECDDPDTCDGIGSCLDNFEIDGLPCGDPGNTQCDNPDTCDGTGSCLDNFELVGVACGDLSSDQCDDPDICDGDGLCDPNYIASGTVCDDVDDCTGSDVCSGDGGCAGTAIAQAPIVEAFGSRYFQVTPLPAGSPGPVALLVTSDDWTCLSVYIDAEGRFTDTPVFQLIDDWGAIMASDELIVPSPGSSYIVQAECGAFLSDPTTVTMGLWGDVDGDGNVGFADMLLAVDGFRDDFSQYPQETMDIWPCLPDGDVGFLDILAMVWTFQDRPYADSGCPVPCQ